MSKTNYLFAYGFLMRMFHGSTKTQTPRMDVEFVCKGWVHGRLYKVEEYPGLILDPDGYPVFGEVLAARAESLWEELDQYEHAFPLIKTGFEYRRVLTSIETPIGLKTCWVYEYAESKENLSEIPSGRFLG